MSSIRRVIVAVSGRVDSAVASLILKQKGYDVVGVFMENWDLKNETGICSVDQDAEDARWVCSKLDIPFHNVSFAKEYWQDVFCYALKEYESGYLPNPVIMYNRKINFDSFYKYAQDKMDANAIATGHYARTTFGNFLENYDTVAGVHLLRPEDTTRDQTIVLSQVHQIPLQRTMFPLGNLTKLKVKKIASEFGIEYIDRKKKHRGRKKLKEFILEYVVDKPGYFRDIDSGLVVGEHKGINRWTVGQRITKSNYLKNFYVSRKEPKSNDIFVAAGSDHPSLYSQFFFTMKPHWIYSIPQPLMQEGRFECKFWCEPETPLQDCFLMVITDNQMLVELVRPLRAIIPGQFAVFYKGNECLGSAKIIQLVPILQSLGHGEQDDIRDGA